MNGRRYEAVSNESVRSAIAFTSMNVIFFIGGQEWQHSAAVLSHLVSELWHAVYCWLCLLLKDSFVLAIACFALAVLGGDPSEKSDNDSDIVDGSGVLAQ